MQAFRMAKPLCVILASEIIISMASLAVEGAWWPTVLWHREVMACGGDSYGHNNGRRRAACFSFSACETKCARGGVTIMAVMRAPRVSIYRLGRAFKLAKGRPASSYGAATCSLRTLEVCRRGGSAAIACLSRGGSLLSNGVQRAACSARPWRWWETETARGVAARPAGRGR